MKTHISLFFLGALFALGLGISGMTQPAKVIAFLNLADWQHWDVSLMLVMGSAIPVYYILYRWIMKRPWPIFEKQFFLPTSKELNRSLILGSVVFGVGWGIAGICPGPALTSLATGKAEIIVFVVSMTLGMTLQSTWSQRKL